MAILALWLGDLKHCVSFLFESLNSAPLVDQDGKTSFHGWSLVITFHRPWFGSHGSGPFLGMLSEARGLSLAVSYFSTWPARLMLLIITIRNLEHSCNTQDPETCFDHHSCSFYQEFNPLAIQWWVVIPSQWVLKTISGFAEQRDCQIQKNNEAHYEKAKEIEIKPTEGKRVCDHRSEKDCWRPENRNLV